MLFVNSNGKICRIRINNGKARANGSQKPYETKTKNLINRYAAEPKKVLKCSTSNIFYFVYNENED